jgi:hypothetical protein
MKKQTAVEWLVNELIELGMVYPLSVAIEKIDKAEAMEKEQIIDAYKSDRHPCLDEDAEQYYNEIFTQYPDK